MSTNSSNTFSLRPVLEKDKLNGPNFLDWYRTLRIVLKQERKGYVLEKILPERLGSKASNAVREAWHKHYDDIVDVKRLMLATMESELQKQFEKVESPIEIITGLKGMFQGQVRVERFQTVKSLFQCKLPEGGPVGPHVKKMINYIDNLTRLDCPVSHKMAIYTILQSLPSSYGPFVMEYDLNDLTSSLTELHDMLVAFESNINAPSVSRTQKVTRFQKPGKGKAIQIMNLDKPANDVVKCKYCDEYGHRRRNCKKLLEDDEEIEKMYPSSGPEREQNAGRRTRGSAS